MIIHNYSLLIIKLFNIPKKKRCFFILSNILFFIIPEGGIELGHSRVAAGITWLGPNTNHSQAPALTDTAW